MTPVSPVSPVSPMTPVNPMTLISSPQWTHESLDTYMKHCMTSITSSGDSSSVLPDARAYSYIVKPLLSSSSEPGENVSTVTEALSKVVYSDGTPNAHMAYGLYDLIVKRCHENMDIRPFMQMNDVLIVLKGSNAHALLFPESCTCSDLDINICINPNLPRQKFEALKSKIEEIVSQAMSVHKKNLDHMFFITSPTGTNLMSDRGIQDFKEMHIHEMRKIGAQSAFESVEVRNFCSRQSFIIRKSEVQQDKVVIMDVPFLPRCNRIPAKKSPFSISFNDTINNTSENGLVSNFSLIRLKMYNMMQVPRDDAVGIDLVVEGDDSVHLQVLPKMRKVKVPSDFIDVCIPGQDDSVLNDMWQNEKVMLLTERNTRVNVLIPDLESLIHEMKSILDTYVGPEAKKQKRIDKLMFLMKKKEEIENEKEKIAYARAQAQAAERAQANAWANARFQATQQQFYGVHLMSGYPHFGRGQAVHNSTPVRVTCGLASHSNNL